MKKHVFISTPIYYASGKPHIGHAYTTIYADVLARYKQMLGYDVFFVTGTDEHGQKIAQKAEQLGLTPQAFVDECSLTFKNLFELLGIKYNCFIRTTDPNHIHVVQEVFKDLNNHGDIYLDHWKGYYCVSCEENFTESQINLVDGNKTCPIGHELEIKNEESYFLNLNDKVEWLKNYYHSHPDFILPSYRVNELENNFLNNLENLSISRTSISWGIPVPINDKHVVYVWLDALFNYLSALGYKSKNDEDYQTFWNNPHAERIHLMSKEITRFHCIYWPIMLNKLGLNQPTNIVSHGWIVTKEGKMSKSLGNVIDPIEVVNKYGLDQFRYFLIKELPIHKDGIFSEDIFVDTINADLANNIGNLSSRTIGMLTKYTSGIIPKYSGHVLEEDAELESLMKQIVKNIHRNIHHFNLDQICVDVIELVKAANKYIETNKPWELFKEEKLPQLHSLLTHLALICQFATYCLSPILIEGTKTIAEQMNFQLQDLNLDEVLNFHSLDNIKVGVSSPVYKRIEK